MGGDEFGGDDMDMEPEMGGDEFGADEPEVAEAIPTAGTQVVKVQHSFMEDDEQLIREYVEKVNGGFGAKIGGDNGANTKSIVAGKNDMGGTTANIAKGGEGGGSDKGFTGSKPQVDDAGNVNKVGGTKTGSFYSKDGKGHGAEKAGAKESGTNTASIFLK